MRSLSAISLLAAILAPAAAVAGPNCTALTVRSSPTQQRADATLVTQVAHQRVGPAQVGRVLTMGPWRFVWATPTNAERGVFLFHKEAKRGYHLVDIWGGVIMPEERADTIDWARRLKGSPPRPLAECFADALTKD
ncbi:MAG: hypothetical protein ABIS14_09710 [Sphingomonas sp.]